LVLIFKKVHQYSMIQVCRMSAGRWL